LKCKVIYGDSLHNRPGYNALKEKYNDEAGLATGDKHFPELQISKNDFNIFNLKEHRPINEKTSQTASMLSEICKTLKVNYLIITHTSVCVDEVEGNHKTGLIHTANAIFIYDKEGEVIAQGYNYSPQITLKPNETDDYELELNYVKTAFRPTIQELVNKFNNL